MSEPKKLVSIIHALVPRYFVRKYQTKPIHDISITISQKVNGTNIQRGSTASLGKKGSIAQERVRNARADHHSFSLNPDTNICNFFLKVSTQAINMVIIIAIIGSQYHINTHIQKIIIADSSVVNHILQSLNAQ